MNYDNFNNSNQLPKFVEQQRVNDNAKAENVSRTKVVKPKKQNTMNNNGNGNSTNKSTKDVPQQPKVRKNKKVSNVASEPLINNKNNDSGLHTNIYNNRTIEPTHEPTHEPAHTLPNSNADNSDYLISDSTNISNSDNVGAVEESNTMVGLSIIMGILALFAIGSLIFVRKKKYYSKEANRNKANNIMYTYRDLEISNSISSYSRNYSVNENTYNSSNPVASFDNQSNDNSYRK